MTATIVMPIEFALESATWSSLSTCEVVLVRFRPRTAPAPETDHLAEIIPLFPPRHQATMELRIDDLLDRRPHLVDA